jgi:hypothetical protein
MTVVEWKEVFCDKIWLQKQRFGDRFMPTTQLILSITYALPQNKIKLEVPCLSRLASYIFIRTDSFIESHISESKGKHKIKKK